MKLLVVAAALVAVVGCASLGKLEQQFQEWKVEFEKVYSSPEEEAMRKKLWLESLHRVEAHNARAAQGLVSWTAGMNQFSDQVRRKKSDPGGAYPQWKTGK